MRIGIDGNEANVGKRVGVSEYGYRLLKELAEQQALIIETPKKLAGISPRP